MFEDSLCELGALTLNCADTGKELEQLLLDRAGLVCSQRAQCMVYWLDGDADKGHGVYGDDIWNGSRAT